ncbi:MAG: plasmid mobilization protein [Sulfuricella sp.]
MSKLFKKMPPTERKTVRYEVRMTRKEADAIRASAETRCISVSDFMRRAALGRRADIRFETEIVLSIRSIVQSIRNLHATFIAQGIAPPTGELGPLLDEAIAALQRISE